jgi:hypothetical protein
MNLVFLSWILPRIIGPRRSGRTYALAKRAEQLGIPLVAADSGHAHHLQQEYPGVTVISWSSLGPGNDEPVILDHYTTERLLQATMDEIAKLRTRALKAEHALAEIEKLVKGCR